MDVTQETIEKKKSKSFWNRLLHLPRKPHNKEKHEDSFRRQSKLYSSLNTTKHEIQSNRSADESENFIMLESSAFSDVHRDAGILFCNKESKTSCFAQREDNKHVQFAPTPMNKYYRVDIKSAPSKKQKDENKENVEETKPTKPARPILRLDRSRKVNFQSSSAEDTQSNIETRLVNVTYVEGPFVKTPSMPRTSTKLTLVDHKNGSVPMLNVSSIVKYNSLPRNAESSKESITSREKYLPAMSQSNSIKNTESQISYQTRPIRPVSDTDGNRRSIQNLNSHRQSCYGVSDLSRVFEGKKVLQVQNQVSNEDTRHRYSLGGLLANSSQMINNSNYHPDNIAEAGYFLPETERNFRFLKGPMPSKGPGYARSLDQPMHAAPRHGCLSESNCNNLNWKRHHASTGHIPNKAINEIGLPLVTDRRKRESSNLTSKSRSKSPHYIPLCETFTSDKIATKKKGNSIQQNKCLSQPINGETSSKCISQKQKMIVCAGVLVENRNKKSKSDVMSVEQHGEKSGFISETRKHAIKSALYTQKRKMVNKICKYNSKQCEDGFSSMADDECSFNCSCPSCIVKLSRSYKRNGLKSLFTLNRDNKYFFTIEPDIKEGNETERLPENQTFEGPMAKAQPHLSSKNEKEAALKSTWYECNDTLCETPHKRKSSKAAALEALALEPCKTPTNKIVDNIYENITEIINSATKRNLKPQDVKRILSTPISTPLKVGNMVKSLTKSQRVLFPDELDKHKTLDQSLKQLFTPEKNSDCFNDSIVLLQEIFQKLSVECRELLQPNTSSSIPGDSASNNTSDNSPSSRYVSDLVKNLKSSELSEADFAVIIGGIAHSIFSETKEKRKMKPLTHSASLPDLEKATLVDKAVSAANSWKDLCNLQIKDVKLNATDQPIINQNTDEKVNELTVSGDSTLSSRQLPDGWSRTPTTESSNLSTDVTSSKLSSSGTDKDSSKYSDNELQLLENAIRLGMGLDPIDKVKTAPTYAASPTKASKYKSRDVLSGKGKLKLKIYYNSGLVTVYVMKATKLSWTNGRELNSYVKMTLIPDASKRVHWRTTVQKAQRNPVFNEKFSFELLPEDEMKRLVFSIWHRDYAKQRSELIGCMSFSVRHVMKNTHNVDGWYRLLREKFGTQKHFAAHTNKNSNCNLLVPV